MIQHRSVHIVFASTSGHTEYVIEALLDSLYSTAPDWQTEATRAEKAQPRDLLGGDILLLASATWNTWGVEGQLNPYMLELFQNEAKNLDLAGKVCACIGLGDHRYFYEARAADLLDNYVELHHGRLLLPTLRIIDEPYGQEEAVKVWARQMVEASRHVGGPKR
jgi:flavodoxin I